MTRYSIFLLGILVAPALATPAVATEANPQKGKAVFDRWCQPCHGGGFGHPGTSALEEKYHGEIPAELEKRTDLEAGVVSYAIRNGISIMPVFRKTEITSEDERDLIDYLSKGHR